jgi:hypothetical protein
MTVNNQPDARTQRQTGSIAVQELHKSNHHRNLEAAVLARAAGIIATKGVAALPLRSVGRPRGSHDAPNRHFANKSALLAALATDGWQHLQATLDKAGLVKTTGPIIRLNAMGQRFLC